MVDNEDSLSAGSTGRTAGLTVAIADAVEALLQILFQQEPVDADDAFTVACFNAADVRSVRPDPSHDESVEVLRFRERHFDASYRGSAGTDSRRSRYAAEMFGLAGIVFCPDGQSDTDIRFGFSSAPLLPEEAFFCAPQPNGPYRGREGHLPSRGAV